MHEDRLESFIKTHRQEFDHFDPSVEIWNKVELSLEVSPIRKLSFRKVLAIAAAVTVLLSTGFLIGNYTAGPGSHQSVAVEQLIEIAPELPKLEKYYDQEFQKKYQQLVSYDYEPEIHDDLDEVDKAMEELKLELIDAPKGLEKEILDNLIESYKMKIKILERVLEQYQREGHLNSTDNDRFTI